MRKDEKWLICGVYCDWLDIKESEPIKWRLTVTGVENHG